MALSILGGSPISEGVNYYLADFFRRGGTQWCFVSDKVKNGPKRVKYGPKAKTRLKGL